MSWIVISLGTAAIMALVNISDKTVVHRYTHSWSTLPLLIGIAQTTVGFIVLGVTHIPPEVTAAASGWAVLSGCLYGMSGFLVIRVLFNQEVSRTIPISQTSPIFAALLASAVLKESVSYLQWLGIIATVLGSILLSLRTSGHSRDVFLHKSFYLLMISAALLGIANVIGKIALAQLPLLYTHGLRLTALGLLFLSLTARATPWTDVKRLIRERSPGLLFVGVNEFITANLSQFLLLWALALGPSSLVTALVGMRSLFVVLYSLSLGIVWHGALGEETSIKVITIKMISTLLIVSGIAAIII